MKTKIIIVEDHEILRAGLHALLDTDPEFEVVGEAATGDEAVRLAEITHPDVVLMDISMPGCSGVEATRRLKALLPEVQVLILTVHEDQSIFMEAMNSGASGYLVKRGLKMELFNAIETVQRGELYVHNTMLRQMLQKPSPTPPAPDQELEQLTAREVEVLRLIAQGNTNSQIARILSISKRTVDFHRSNLMSKLGVQSRVDLVRFAANHGLVVFSPITFA